MARHDPARSPYPLLTADQVERIYGLTDELRLHRDWVVVPLMAKEPGLEMMMPDGKLLIRAPYGDRFGAWFDGLQERLGRLNLSPVPRNDPLDPHPRLAPKRQGGPPSGRERPPGG